MDNYLPMGSLEMGLDVLQIMRNIHVFVSRFTYNMNMQQFVEYRPDKASKHLNTIKIQSIAASIRQHGLGVLNTTVNFTYQFLSSKFHIFSQFLFDDYIRAHLSREHRWFKKHKNEPEVNNMYPYERALKFARDIRKLGVNDVNKSFLDQLRILITEIGESFCCIFHFSFFLYLLCGFALHLTMPLFFTSFSMCVPFNLFIPLTGNALGYVRMVRSASMYYCSEAVKYLPDFDDLISFEDCAGKGLKVPTYAGEEEPIGESMLFFFTHVPCFWCCFLQTMLLVIRRKNMSFDCIGCLDYQSYGLSLRISPSFLFFSFLFSSFFLPFLNTTYISLFHRA